MRHTHTAAVLAAAALVLGAASAAAQIDYRNLDDGRPVHTEDAYPIERYAFELLAPVRFEAFPGGLDNTIVAPEVEYGAFMNGQVGLALPLARVHAPGASDFGLAGLRLHAFYNFNTESRSLPAFAVRTDLALPVGALAGDVARLAVRGIATRSWGLTRAHLNAAWSFGSENGLARAEAAPRWSGSLAVDRTLFRQSLVLLVEGLAEQEVRGGPTVATLAAGARWQWTPTAVLDLGVSRRLTSDGPDFGLTLGLSHAFALHGLLPAGR
jgi:hypothetical protein